MQERVYGVDFSGAKDAGKKIWIAQAVPRGQGIMVEACSPSTELLHCKARNEARCFLRYETSSPMRKTRHLAVTSHSACPRT